MRLAEAFRDQARSCAALGSPLMERLCRGLAGRIQPGTALAGRLLDWPGDLSSSGASLPLRLAGGLHALVRLGREPALAEAYGAGLPEAALAEAALAAMARHEAFLLGWIESPPQTNEIRRSAVLIAAAAELAARQPLPFVLSELGASAGLNLLWDRYGLEAGGAALGPAEPVAVLRPDWAGPLPPEAAVQVAARAGVDMNPLDPVADRLRLLAYLWPDQAERIARTEAALDAAAEARPEVVRGDAVDWLAARLAAPLPGRLHLVFHTIAWQYFPPEAQARGAALLAEAGARATAAAPLAHLAMEADGRGPGAAVSLTLWPGGEPEPLGRADFHGRWIAWGASTSPPVGL